MGLRVKKALRWLRMKSVFGAMTTIDIGITIRLKILIPIYNAASRFSKKLWVSCILYYLRYKVEFDWLIYQDNMLRCRCPVVSFDGRVQG